MQLRGIINHDFQRSKSPRLFISPGKVGLCDDVNNSFKFIEVALWIITVDQ